MQSVLTLGQVCHHLSSTIKTNKYYYIIKVNLQVQHFACIHTHFNYEKVCPVVLKTMNAFKMPFY